MTAQCGGGGLAPPPSDAGTSRASVGSHTVDREVASHPTVQGCETAPHVGRQHRRPPGCESAVPTTAPHGRSVCRGRLSDSGSPFPHQPPVHQPDEEMRGGTPRGLWGSAQWREVVWFSEPRTVSLWVHGVVITSVGSISPLAPRVPPAGLPRGWGGWERRGGAGSQPLPRELSTSLLAEATNNSHHLGNSGAVRSSVPETRRVVNHRASVGLPRLTAP